VRPATAGPIARARLSETPDKVIALASSSRGTISGTIACHTGWFIATPIPRAEVSERSNQGVIQPKSVTTPRTPATTVIHVCVKSRYLRLSTRSPMAPAGRAKRKRGRLEAVPSRATRSGEVVSEVISQAAPTSCIQVPMLETVAARKRARKTSSRSGDQAVAGAAFASALMGGALYRGPGGVPRLDFPGPGVLFACLAARSPHGDHHEKRPAARARLRDVVGCSGGGFPDHGVRGGPAHRRHGPARGGEQRHRGEGRQDRCRGARRQGEEAQGGASGGRPRAHHHARHHQ